MPFFGDMRQIIADLLTNCISNGRDHTNAGEAAAFNATMGAGAAA